jgi:ABC-type multidrug transport system ATPase subunit
MFAYLLLSLGEPILGLDSDTAWSGFRLLRKLANNGQAILCAIHQPSGTLFQIFHNLLFLSAEKAVWNYRPKLSDFDRLLREAGSQKMRGKLKRRMLWRGS